MSAPTLTPAQELIEVRAGIIALDYRDTETDRERRALQTRRAALIELLEEGME